jgi:RIO kinase 1
MKRGNPTLSAKHDSRFSIPGALTLAHDIVPYEEIASFYDEGFITDVLFAVKSGKEATVYCAKAHPGRPERYYALKHYRPLAHRSFRNDAVYQEGRFGRETREVRAMRTKTRKGRAFQFGTWLAHEYATLRTLHEAGADVPRPIAAGANGLLLEFVGDGDVPAPMLAAVRLGSEEAHRLLESLLRNVANLLAHHVVHGDLSAYNVLYCQGRPVIIDFPQAADARVNPNAPLLLARDVTNLCRYFSRQGVDCDPVNTADDLWDRYMHARL